MRCTLFFMFMFYIYYMFICLFIGYYCVLFCEMICVLWTLKKKNQEFLSPNLTSIIISKQESKLRLGLVGEAITATYRQWKSAHEPEVRYMEKSTDGQDHHSRKNKIQEDCKGYTPDYLSVSIAGSFAKWHILISRV